MRCKKAKSGHPGTPMALAPVAYTLWQDVLRYDPMDPSWPNRDRFVLSAGHASMLLYALLHLSGTRRLGKDGPTEAEAVSLDDIKQFRQLSSVTPGHPEYSFTSGVETTTGPWARAWRTLWGWPSPSAGSPPATTGPASRSTTTESIPSAATAT